MVCVMRIITADEFGANWPQLLSQLTEGEEFLLTDAGRPVSRVLPPMPGNLKTREVNTTPDLRTIMCERFKS